MNYHNKKFRILSTSENSDLSIEMVFHYTQIKDIVSCSYSDKYTLRQAQGTFPSNKNILKGNLLGLVKEDGRIEMSYQQINSKKEIMTGTCISTPELLANGKLLLHEKWQWTSGDRTFGESTLEEI